MYAHYALHKLHILPQDLWVMDPYHRAFIYGSIDQYLTDQERENKKRK